MYFSGLEAYKKSDYDTADKYFSKVSIFSAIKPPALFRQARCATFRGDTRRAYTNYSMILFMYPHTRLYAVSEYNLAVLLYENGKQSAEKHFSHIIKYFPKTDFALAGVYYIANIDIDKAQKTKIRRRKLKLKRKALEHYIRYIELAPNGRFVQEAINNVIPLNIEIGGKNNYILANSYFVRKMHDEASEYFSAAPLDISWAKYAKNEFERKNIKYAKLLVEHGLKYYSNTVEKQDMYDAVDNYISLYSDKKTAVVRLIKDCPNSNGMDYLLYLKAKYSEVSEKYIIREKLYNDYPESVFTPEALYKNFYSLIDKEEYDKALKLARKHAARFKKSDTAPAVLFWTGKIYERKHKPAYSKSCYKSVL